MLHRFRRRIVLADIQARLRTGLQTGLHGLIVIATVFLLLRLLSWSIKTPTPSLNLVLILTAVFGAVVFVHALVSGIRGKTVHPGHAAERLDLSQATHNRIATAIALLRSGDESSFARAAIHDGFEHLVRLQAEEPQVDLPKFSWQRAVFSLTAAATLMIAGLFLVPQPGSVAGRDTADGRASSETTQPPVSPAPENADKPAPRPTDPAKNIPSERPVLRPSDTAAEENGKRPEPGSESRSKGAMARHASGESRSSQSESNSSSAANGGGAKSEPGDNEPGKPPKPRGAKRQTASQAKADPEAEKKGGSIDARGSSGAGSTLTAQNEWSSHVKAKSDDSDDFQDDEEPDEEMDPDKQRLGVQPALKNRSSQVSRELSLFTGTEVGNDQNRGRSGPGGQKKSRGTATMIMGVPVPGFVKGRLLPGPTKSTQEEVEPSPSEGEYANAANLPLASSEEQPQEHYHPAAADSVRARNYLLNIHADHDPALNRNDSDK
ncbi:MAG: hypothetical protein ACRDBP_11700 [Luteolibacter sp.]